MHDRDNSSDVIHVGSIPVHLNPKEREPKSYNYDESLPVHRQNTRRSRIDLGSKRDLKSNARSYQVERLEFLNDSCQEYKSSLPIHFGKKNEVFVSKLQSLDTGPKESVVTDNSLPFEPPFDICLPGGGNVKHRNIYVVKEGGTVKDYRLLRPGMVLLKHYITPREQVFSCFNCQHLYELEMGIGILFSRIPILG